MWFIILLLLAAAFAGYAFYTQFSNTDPTQTFYKRAWAALVAAGVAIGAAIMSLFQGGAAP